MENLKCSRCGSSTVSIIRNNELRCNICDYYTKIFDIDFEDKVPKNIMEQIKNFIHTGNLLLAIKLYKETMDVSLAFAKTAIDTINVKYNLRQSIQKSTIVKSLEKLIFILLLSSIVLSFIPDAIEIPFFILSAIIILSGIRTYCHKKDKIIQNFKNYTNLFSQQKIKNLYFTIFIILVIFILFIAAMFSLIDPGNEDFLRNVREITRNNNISSFTFKFLYYFLLAILVTLITKIALKRVRNIINN